MRKSLVKNKGAWLVFAYDLSAAMLSWLVVHSLIYGNLKVFSALQFLFIVTGFSFSLKLFRNYAALWKTISAEDLKRNVYTAFSGAFIFFMLEFLVSRLSGFARAEVLFYPTLTLFMMLAGRFIYRQYFLYRQPPVKGQDLIIIGAGDGANLFLKENALLNQPYSVKALLDDDKKLQGKSLRGITIAGASDLLLEEPFIAQYPQAEILIAIPSLEQQQAQQLYKKCIQSNRKVRILPSVLELLDGSKATDLRTVKLEDLLGRQEVSLDWQRLSNAIKNKRVLVSGGGGSIGSELCRQIAQLAPKELLVVDNSEFNLYQIELELKNKYPQLAIKISLVSVADKESIKILFSDHQPQVVFHAAAYKHVPMLEQQVCIAVQNNILGTQVMADISAAHGVEKFVLISTDKAVNPSNIMGMTKRAAEIYCQNMNGHSDTAFITVRFGNVLGSAGSVVPLFKKQLAVGGPLTVTHPDITRYFMTIPEASRLILQAMANGQGGEIFVLDMGEPIKIVSLAEQMIRLSGKVPYQDITIEFTGLRPGEKLYEELFHDAEQLTQTEHPKILKAWVRQQDWICLQAIFADIAEQHRLLNDNGLLELLIQLVPEYNFNAKEESAA